LTFTKFDGTKNIKSVYHRQHVARELAPRETSLLVVFVFVGFVNIDRAQEMRLQPHSRKATDVHLAVMD